MTDEQWLDEDFDDDDELEVVVPEELITRIDSALLAHMKRAFQKVAKIVHLAMTSIPEPSDNVTDVFYAKRIPHLVQTGQMESQGDLRRMRFSEARLPGPPLASSELKKLAAQRQYFTLGRIYSEGQGVTQNYATALNWYHMGAERGDVWSQANVGRFYLEGLGVQKDYKQAYFWYRLAVNGSSDTRPFLRWLEQVALKLTPSERADVDKQVAAWRAIAWA